MDQSTQTISALPHRMIEDMRMRKLSPKTQGSYIRAVRQLATYLGRSPDAATAEDLRGYQLHLVDHGMSPVSLNATIIGLRFFFEVTLGHEELMAKMQPVHVPYKLPVVLSREEVARLIAAARNLKHQTALSVAYGAGLRAWWREARTQGKMLDGGWLFPGLDPIDQLTTRQLNRAIHAAAEAAGIDKRISMHTLHHSFATHLLEQKVDIRVIQVLLGHKKLETTALYAQVATDLLREVVSLNARACRSRSHSSALEHPEPIADFGWNFSRRRGSARTPGHLRPVAKRRRRAVPKQGRSRRRAGLLWSNDGPALFALFDDLDDAGFDVTDLRMHVRLGQLLSLHGVLAH